MSAPKATPRCYSCEHCDKQFTRASDRTRHTRLVHDNQRHPCPSCGKLFSRPDAVNRHLNVCLLGKQHVCTTCGETFENLFDVNFHYRSAHGQGAGPSRKRRETSATTVGTVQARKITKLSATGVRVDSDPLNPTINELPEDEELHNVYTQNWNAIRTKFYKTQRVQDIFNYRLMTADTSLIEESLLADLFNGQEFRFKINLSYGFVLRNNDSGELRYYHSSQNNGEVLDSPRLIENDADFRSFLVDIRQHDVLEWARQQRPNSRWTVETVTNVTFYVSKLLEYPIGAAVKLPNFILNNQGLVALVKDENNNFPYVDHLCLFRCLALFSGESVHTLNKSTLAYFQQFVKDRTTPESFKGITLSELHDVEACFKININVFALKEMKETGDEEEEEKEDEEEEGEDEEGEKDGHETAAAAAAGGGGGATEPQRIVATLVRRSIGQYERTMDVNLYQQHFSYISDIRTYSKCFSCSKCGKLWQSHRLLTRHEATCTEKVKHRYVGGVFQLEPTIFDDLEEEGIFVQEDLRFYPFQATYDLEAFFKKDNLPENSKYQTWTAQHIPLSVSICSNVPGMTEPTCYISDGDPNKLIQTMMNRLKEISAESYRLMIGRFETVLIELDTAIKVAEQREPVSAAAEEGEKQKQRKIKEHPLQTLKTRLDSWMKELPVLGFNSGKYDLNLIKPQLMKCLMEMEPLKFTVKKNNNFMCLKTEWFKFLDICNYLAPGVSYDKFLKAFDCSVSKGCFPYEWVDSLDKLTFPTLPPHEAFYSSLKNENITAEDYKECQRVWTDERMTTFKEYLIWYNNRDVTPFLEAVAKMSAFYKAKKIDMFKEGISVPGLTMKYLFMNLDPHTYFTLFDERNADLHHLVKDNVVGGPSIIFHRYHEVGKTYIRKDEFGDEAKLCGGVLGFDANALYLNCLMQEMPTGWFIKRKAPDFKPEGSHKYGRTAMEWLEHEAAREGVRIRHQFNGKEKRVGRRSLPVDGWCKETNTCYQFHGCYWHGHECRLNRNADGEQVLVNTVRGKPMQELRQETQKNSEYIRNLGYNLKEMWECQWVACKRASPDLRSFITHNFRRASEKIARMSEGEVLARIQNGALFGLIECDIEVPPALEKHFSEMQPIFKNASVSRADLSDHMRDHAEEHGYLSQPRRMLIGSYRGEKILLATPLLRWYLSHGLQVTKIHQTIEYHPEACFKGFGDAVSEARRAGDANPAQAVVADTMKLLGNSGYGKTITNKENHRNISLADSTTASHLVNSPLFRRLSEVSEDLYEMEMNKRVIKLDLPLHIGFFVYQYAKLRMLEFYYDFLDKYIDRKDFQYVEMDTDSAYLALSAPTLEAVIRPDMRESFYQNWEKWLPAEACPRHKENFIHSKMKEEGAEEEEEEEACWTTSPCCVAQRKFDKRTPGLFKVEWEGQGIIGLCSKTYYCFGDHDKISCKGLSKRQNNIKKEEYLHVLRSGKAGKGTNQSFRVKDNTVYTYRQIRAGLSYFYPKRKVLADGETTLPIDL